MANAKNKTTISFFCHKKVFRKLTKVTLIREEPKMFYPINGLY